MSGRRGARDWTRRGVLAVGPACALSGLTAAAEGFGPDNAALAARYPVRNPALLPFAPDSLWNTPIGLGAALAATTAFTAVIGGTGAAMGDPTVERVRTGIEENAIVLALGPGGEPSTLDGVDPADLAAARAGHPDSPDVEPAALLPNGRSIGFRHPGRAPGHADGARPRAVLFDPDAPIDAPAQQRLRGLPLPRDWVKTNRPFSQMTAAERAEHTVVHRGVARTIEQLGQTVVGNACLAIVAHDPFEGAGTCVLQVLGAERPAPGTPLWSWGVPDAARTPIVAPGPPMATPLGSFLTGWLSLWLGASSRELWPGAGAMRHLLHFRDGRAAPRPGDVLTAGRFRALVTGPATLRAGSWAAGTAEGFLAVAAEAQDGLGAAAPAGAPLLRDGRRIARLRRDSRFEEPPTPFPGWRREADPADWGGGPEPASNRVRFAPGAENYLDPSRFGSHGGSHGSAIGGTILIDELCADGEAVDTIRHVIGVNVGVVFLEGRPPSDVASLQGQTPLERFRATFQMNPWAEGADATARTRTAVRAHGRVWPAAARDAGGRDPVGDGFTIYDGVDPLVRMGSLLALPSAAWIAANPERARAEGLAPFDLDALATLPARRIAWALQRFGCIPLDTVPRGQRDKQSFMFNCEERHIPGRPGAAGRRDMGLRFYERFGFQMWAEHDWVRPHPADVEHPGAPSATEAWRRDVVAIMRRLCVVADNWPDSPGGAGPRLFDHAPAPVSLLGGVFRRDGAAAPFAALRLLRDGAPPETAPLDVFGRPHRNRADNRDRAAGLCLWGDLDRGWWRVGDDSGRLSPPIWLELGGRRIGEWSLS